MLDPRSLVPLDRECLARAVAKTHRVVIAEEGPMRGGAGAWFAWVVMEECEAACTADAGAIAAACRRVLK